MKSRTVVTCFVVAALGLQVAAGFKLVAPPQRFTALAFLRVAPTPALWPFLDYDMYTQPHEMGAWRERVVLVAVEPGGAARPLSHHDLGLTWRRYRDEVLNAVRAGQAVAAERVADGLEARGLPRPEALRVEHVRLVIGRDGLEPQPPRVVRVVRLAPQ